MPIASGPLKPALAASIALPGLLRPVVIGERVLIDGGATNPLPFDHLRGRADVVVAVDISGEPAEERRDLPNPWEAWSSPCWSWPTPSSARSSSTARPT